ncbi:hypothetical protein BH24CHL6_BH24CHL6_03720 [soil metagenome]
MLGSALDSQAQELVAFLNAGLEPTRPSVRTAHALIPAPYGVYHAADGWLVLAMAPLVALAAAIDAPALASMDDELDGTTRQAEIEALVAPIIRRRTTAEWIAHFDELRLWSGRVYTYAELEADPHVRAIGAFVEIEHPVAGRLRMPAPPISLSSTPTAVRLAPPPLGEHTDSVLREVCGYSDRQIDQLRASGTLGTRQTAPS